MANVPVTTTELGAAGFAPDQWGMEILQDLPARSVMFNLIEPYEIGPGEVLTAPLLAARTVTADTQRTSTSTSDITFEDVTDDGQTFTDRFVYNAVQVPYAVMNDMPVERLTLFLNGLAEQTVWALANDFDAQTLGLYSSADNSVGSSAAEFTIANLAEAKRLLKAANAPEPYVAVLPATQEDHLALTDELSRYDARGDTSMVTIGDSKYRWQSMDIYTTGNVPTASNTAHGLVFSLAGIRAKRRPIVTKDFDYPTRLSRRIVTYLDYSYLNTFSDWIVDFQTTDQ